MPNPLDNDSRKGHAGLRLTRRGKEMPRESEPSVINQIQLYRPLCSKCGTLTQLARIEPSDDPDHDLRTFECSMCGNSDVVKIKFK